MSITFIKQIIDIERTKILTALRYNHTSVDHEFLEEVEQQFQELEKKLTGTEEYAPLYITDVSDKDLFRIFPYLSIDTRDQNAVWALDEDDMFEVPAHLGIFTPPVGVYLPHITRGS